MEVEKGLADLSITASSAPNLRVVSVWVAGLLEDK
jgi:hypothetical protein